MTTTRPVLLLSLLGRLDRVAAGLCSGLGVLLPLFQPGGDSGARDTKGTLEAAQRAALVIGAENFRAALLGIAIWRRCVTALATTSAALVALLAVGSVAIAHELITATM
jgi:hypothetical protein